GVTRTGIIWCVQHGHTRDDPSAPSGLNSRGAVVSSSLARRALYEAFPAEEARRLVERFEWHYTPNHGSWLDMAESELAVLSGQCLDRRISDKPILTE